MIIDGPLFLSRLENIEVDRSWSILGPLDVPRAGPSKIKGDFNMELL